MTVRSSGPTDVVGYLYDSSYRLITFNDDVVPGVDTNFAFSVPVSPGRYFLDVTGYDVGVTGPYSVQTTLQTANSSASVVSNGGFESGASSWVQLATGGQPIITTSSSIAHTGSNVAWLGGYVSGTDIVYQDVTIPAGASQVTLAYWYLISTQEPAGSTAYDIMTVAIQNPSTGATLATAGELLECQRPFGMVPEPMRSTCRRTRARPSGCDSPR